MSIRLARIASLLVLFGSLTAIEADLAPAAHAAPGIAFVQSAAFGTGSRVASTQVQLAKPIAVGDLLVGWFSQYKAAGSVHVVDNVNGTWTRAPGSVMFGSAGDNALYYVQNSLAAPAGVTVTVSGPAPAYLQGAVSDYTGVATSAALDQIAVAAGVSTTMTSGPTAAVPAGELVFSALVTGGSPNGVSAGSSQGVTYTARAGTGSGSVFEQDITAAAAGAQVGSARLNASTDWYAVVATFHPISVGVVAVPPAAPTGLVKTSDTAVQVGLAWTASTDNVPVTGYAVSRNGVVVGTSVTTSFVDASVAASTSYSYTVTASNGAGQVSVASAALVVLTPPPAGCTTASLVSAVASANATTGGTVTLQSGCLYTLSTADNATDGGTALPVITGKVTIQGNGATIMRSALGGTPHFRVLDVAAGGSLTVTALTLSNGIADNGRDGGGAIDNHGTLAVTDSTFSSNSSPATSGTSGGAINNSGSLTVTKSNFTANTAMEGGGVFNQNSTTITQSVFTNNVATIYGGGAILNAFGTTNVSASLFVGNSGPGGGVIDNDTTMNISDSTFVNNTGGSHGGGAIQNFGIVNLTTSTLSGNTSPYGADIYNYGSSTLTVSTSIVADGVSGSNCGGSAIIDGGYNLDTGSSCGFSASHSSKSSTRPQLQPLAANGGPTQTMALTPGSAAIDAIPVSGAGCSGGFDQRGVARPQGGGCDIGAYELIVSSNDKQPPTTPSGLAVTSAVAGAVVLSWSASTDNVAVAGYTVYRGASPIGTTSGATTGYTDATAASATTYVYSVDAFDAAGNHSPQSAPLSVTTTTPPPVSPHWIQGGAVGTGSPVTSVTISLNAVAGGDLLVGWFGQYNSGGQVQVSDNVNGAWTRASPSTAFANGGGDIALFYVQNAAAAPAGLIVTISATSATYLQGSAAEYAGIARTGSLDQMSVARGTGTTADSGATGSVAAGELLFGGFMTGSSPGKVTAISGLVAHDRTGSFSVDDADMAVRVAGPQHASWTLQNPADWYVVAAVFHAAAGP